MKQLHFLIISGYNKLIYNLIEYLIDAGHLVDIICSENDLFWLNKFTYNLRIITEEKVQLNKYNYFIQLGKPLFYYKIPHIVFTARLLKDNVIKVFIDIASESGVSKLISNNVNYDLNNLDTLYKVLYEGFIDLVILLSRENNIQYDRRISYNNFLNNLIEYDSNLNKLINFYKRLESNSENIFYLNNIANNHKKKIFIENIKLSNQELEFLMLYLLMLLNSRASATYKYDFIWGNKVLTKYIEMLDSDNYINISKKLSAEVYNILNSNFFSSCNLLIDKPQFALQVNPTHDTEQLYKYLVLCIYDFKKKSLKIYYSQELYFFGSVQKYIKYFCENFITWKNNNLAIKKFLYSEFSLFKNMYDKINNTTRPFPENKTIRDLFEEQVRLKPNNLAIVYKDIRLSYEELNNRANQLANYLLEQYIIKSNDVIALCLDRSEYTIIAILAVLKCGGAYASIDTNAIERTYYILNDINPRLILTISEYKGVVESINSSKIIAIRNKTKIVKEGLVKYQQNKFKIILLDTKKIQDELSGKPISDPKSKIKASDLAYVSYTSGTNGYPKGTLIEHKSLVNFVTHHFQIINKKDIVLNYINYTFDAVNTELYVALLHGNALHIVPNEIRLDLKALFNYIIEHNISFVVMPSAIASEFLYDFDINKTGIRTVITGGETYNGPLKINNVNLINAYGPTETTVCALLNKYKAGDSKNNIGKPISNVQCYVLDKNLLPLPYGVIGELYIGGAGVARGYLNEKKLTQEKFISNPFQTTQEKQKNVNNILYKTGDLVRILRNGDFEFIQRNDNQIKIRGYRIEISEIEGKILEYKNIKQVLVVLQECKNNKYLICYYVSDVKIQENAISNFLITKLPEYMIPNRFIPISKMPISVNGKININELPPLSLTASGETPTNLQEELICSAFKEILGITDIGINDDFFKLGGNSINAIRLTSKLQSNFDIKLGDILSLKTPKQLAKNAKFGKNMLKSKLERIKQLYKLKTDYSMHIDESTQNKIQNYIAESKNFEFNPLAKKNIRSVLLTGATGFLGCNLLYQLLLQTQYKIYLFIRASSTEEAHARISYKLLYYFNIDFSKYLSRVYFVIGNLIEEKLGLCPNSYNKLINNIDSIIHSAALVKHYGNYKEFYYTNVQSTQNLLELAKLTLRKDFHYISTTASLNNSYANYEYNIYTENSNLADIPIKYKNLYEQTKYEGEQIVHKYKQYGIKANIYRLGNLAFMLKKGIAQENIEQNAFYNWIQCLISLGYVAPEISEVDITPPDMAANAIIKLFDKLELTNQIFHIFNPNKFDITKATIKGSVILKTVPMKQFIDIIIKYVNNNKYGYVERFLLHQGWLDDVPIYNFSNSILQYRTIHILKKLDFEWLPITNTIFETYLNNIKMRLKMNNHKIFDDFHRITQFLPTPIYWLDTNAMLIGANDNFFKTMGVSSEYAIGKTGYDVYPTEIADHIVKHDKYVMQSGVSSAQEELTRDITTGTPRYFQAFKTPIRNESNIVIGLVGTLIEITAQKEAERLQLENEKHKVIEEQQEKFKKIVDQVVHDIRSPIASMQMILPSCKKLPEDERISLNKAASRVLDIANRLLNEVKPAKHEELSENQMKANLPTLISSEIFEVIAEKKYEYKQKTIDFCAHISNNSYFVFLNIISSDFKRMLSNLINNAVDAIKDKIGKIDLYLDTIDHHVKIILQDNGSGMPDSVREKILNNISVTAGKTDGHGIGFSQIRDTLENSGGKLNIESSIGVGTKIILTFPKAETPDWIAKEIELSNNDIIVILDDDESIHGAWETRFRTATPNIIRKHFEQGEEAITFINGLDKAEKEKVFLLTDYELLDQGLHGLHVVKQTGITRSILVTSHHNSKEVRDLAKLHNTKVLPKPLAPQIPIKIVEQKAEAIKDDAKKQIDNALSRVDIVLVDDDIEYSNNLKDL